MPAAARQTDPVVGSGIHMVQKPGTPPPTPTPQSVTFQGQISTGAVSSVLIEGQPAAVVGSEASLTDPSNHLPGDGVFAPPASEKGTVSAGSATVSIGGVPAARVGDPVVTCAPAAPEASKITAGATTVEIGG